MPFDAYQVSPIPVILERTARLAQNQGLTAQILNPFVILNSVSAFATLRFAEHELTLEGLMVNRKDRNTGLGSMFLDQILAIADHLKLRITTNVISHSRVSDENGPGQAELLNWCYGRGFAGGATLLTRPPKEAYTIASSELKSP